jgi:lipopolysaccharide/colanic/teichoic acid biosynthesis glycosyltransferase
MRTSGAHRLVSARRRQRATPATSQAELNGLVDRLAAEVDWDSVLPLRAHDWTWHFAQSTKRLIDIVVAAIGLLVLAPFFLLVALVIRADSPGPIFYPWVVVGFRGRRFTGYKLRTMVSDADLLKDEFRDLNEMSGPVFKIRNDPRVTRVGRLLRKYSIDELPQLWSVLLGDMSVVGPRPLGRGEFAECRPDQRRKLAVRPGITCIWQVSGRSSITSFESWVNLDLEYIRTWGLVLDAKILLRTIPVVVRGRNAY